MRKISVAGCVFLLLLSGCVSESTIVGNDRPGQPRTDMKEAARTRMSLGLNYLQRGDNTQAKYNLEKAKQLAPDLAEIDNALAYYYQQVGELKQAEDAYRSALRKDSNNADTYNNFGAFLCQHQKYQQAEELLLAAIKRPGYIRVADSYENLALCELEQKNYIQYHQYLKQSLQHNSNRSSALYNMAVMEYAMGNLAEAKKWQSRLHQLGQVSPEATLLRYIVAYYSGDVAEQQIAEKFLLSVYPGSTEAAMLLASDFSQSKPEQMRKAYKSSLMQDDAAAATVTSNDKPKMKIVKRKSAAAAKTASVPAVAAALPDAQLPAETPDTEAFTSTDSAIAAQNSEAVSAEPAAETIAQAPEQNINPTVTETVAGTEQVEADSSLSSNPAQSTSTEAEELAALAAPEPMPAETLTTQQPAVVSAEANTITSAEPDAAIMAQEQQPEQQAAQPVAEVEVAQSEPQQQTTSDNAAEMAAQTHKVAAGETLYSIASRYRLSVSELQAMNNLSNAALIKTGQVLKLTATAVAPSAAPKPAMEQVSGEIPATYQVKDGESMFSISYKYNIKLDTLLKWNNMTVDQPLSIGQTIYLRDPATSSL
ncbi:type IV pilus biogenesis/stability protein PilW [Rheinheimera sp. 4Y26]|uniref:type IV pilus biogenesis/stability protein PilW n=1 Tax=Rheinheimera sp. 4Y26 TaxID=2977811 RepID=UPI0021B0B2D6|nr:type IV pilus biogenesis/stability protein PilW [Rheinheimera sp. 4Y26]MCT6698536.1 type IV pilus biogenesis/stability protein PilW [Rheinheimera sp. 4Y26]